MDRDSKGFSGSLLAKLEQTLELQVNPSKKMA